MLEASVLERIPEGVRVNVERETFPGMVADGTLFARHDPAYWLDVGTPERFLQASLDLLDGRRAERLDAPEPSAGVTGTLHAPAVLGPAVTIAGGAEVRRSVLGDGASVGTGATVEDAVLLPGATVAPGATVRGSILGAGAQVGADAVVDELSVIGDAVSVAAGEVLHGERRPDPSSS